MSKSANGAKKSTELAYMYAKRSDGTYRQVLIQDAEGRVHGRCYFRPGTLVDTTFHKIITGSMGYHWTDAFTDKELLSYDEIDAPMVTKLREDSIKANKMKLFVNSRGEAFDGQDFHMYMS